MGIKLPPATNTAEKNQLLFMKWLAKYHPGVYNAQLALSATGNELSGIADIFSSIGNGLSSILTQAPDILSSYFEGKGAIAQVQAQANLIKVNLQRAQAGQAPINAQGQVDTSAAGLNLPTDAAGNLAMITKSFLPFLVIGGVALAIYLFFRRKRR